MTLEQQKAKELVEKYENSAYNCLTKTGDGTEISELAKECVIIAVDEILNLSSIKAKPEECLKHVQFWQQVKQEIINLK